MDESTDQLGGQSEAIDALRGDGPVWCFQCGNEYPPEVMECRECGVPTTAERPTDAIAVGAPEEDQLAYELHEWTGHSRSVLDGMLNASDISHAWQGATLIVREADEEVVDDAIAATEVVAMPTLDLTQPTMVYELADLSEEHHARLLRRLGDEGVSHGFDRAGDLHVYEKDEERVDEVFETLDEADASEREFGPGIDQDPLVVISDLFIAVGRVKKLPTDSKGIISTVELSALVEQMRLPYGMSADVWADVVDRSGQLSAVLSGDDEEDWTDEEIQELADQLHARLRRMV